MGLGLLKESALGEIVEHWADSSKGNARKFGQLAIWGTDQCGSAQEGKDDLEPCSIIGTIFVLERTGRACFTSYIRHECICAKVQVTGSVQKGKIKSSTLFSQVRGRECRYEERAIPRIALFNQLLQLSPNLRDG